MKRNPLWSMTLCKSRQRSEFCTTILFARSSAMPFGQYTSRPTGSILLMSSPSGKYNDLLPSSNGGFSGDLLTTLLHYDEHGACVYWIWGSSSESVSSSQMAWSSGSSDYCLHQRETMICRQICTFRASLPSYYDIFDLHDCDACDESV